MRPFYTPKIHYLRNQEILMTQKKYPVQNLPGITAGYILAFLILFISIQDISAQAVRTSVKHPAWTRNKRVICMGECQILRQLSCSSVFPQKKTTVLFSRKCTSVPYLIMPASLAAAEISFLIASRASS